MYHLSFNHNYLYIYQFYFFPSHDLITVNHIFVKFIIILIQAIYIIRLITHFLEPINEHNFLNHILFPTFFHNLIYTLHSL